MFKRCLLTLAVVLLTSSMAFACTYQCKSCTSYKTYYSPCRVKKYEPCKKTYPVYKKDSDQVAKKSVWSRVCDYVRSYYR